jgi:hypothetical protein
MSHVLTLEIPDEVYQPLAVAAARAGQTPEEWALTRLRALAPPPAEQAAALARLMRHAGAVDLGRPTGAANDGIDAELAREAADSHEGTP